MSRQNIYDDDLFFKSYKKLRSGDNANILVEIPALFELLPSLEGLNILDLGCGYGEHCSQYIDMGANKVIGIDISEKMLAIAKEENASPKISYKCMAIEDIVDLHDHFDLIVSSLAVHYVEDFEEVVKQVFESLNTNGSFVFSQEHPLNSCFTYGERWTEDKEGNKIHANISNYSFDGQRESRWFKDGIIKYHRTFSSIVNTLIEAGFTIEKIIEPVPSAETMKKFPKYKDNIHKPDFLLISARKS